YDATWARLVSSVAVRGFSEVQIDLRTAHVLPEALLTIPLFPSSESAGGQPYTILAQSATATRFAINSDYRFRQLSQPAEIIERPLTDPLRALAAIKRGEIDILDRVF